MTEVLEIRGAATGGKDAPVRDATGPHEATDTLRSTAYAQVLDLLCEGEVEGLVDGLKSVYLDDVPLQNEDGTFNFSGVSVQLAAGTQDQPRLSGLVGVASEQAVGVRVTAATPVVRTVTNPDTDAVRIRLSMVLSKQDTKTGDLMGTSVQIAIDVQSNGGGFVPQPIGRSFRQSANPATTAADAIQMVVEWRGTVLSNGAGGTASQFIKYRVEYRLVGAATWTTYKDDALRSTDIGPNSWQLIFRGGVKLPTRTYTITGLSQGLYEARVVKTGGGGTVVLKSLYIGVPVLSDTITGKNTSTYQRGYRINLTGLPPWDIRVRRITADSTSVTLRNQTVWDGYTELIDERFRYPNSAMALVRVDASQHSSVPRRSYHMKLLRVKIPSNYDPIERTYTGVWDGTFKIAWTDNPAWCFYDLVTNPRYGLGRWVSAAQVDKWALYSIAKYCDELVPDGYGHEEPRFTCNVYWQQANEAFKVLAAMASIFRGMVYAAGGTITAVQDAPSDPVFLFTEANVEEGLFTYSGSSRTARHTTVLVLWNDPDDGYRSKPEYVEDVEGIARYGVRQLELPAVGCISRGQARRVGEWALYSEQHETETVTFRTGYVGIYVRPGVVVAVQDAHRAGVRFGGLLRAADSAAVTLDAPVTLAENELYSLKVVLPDGRLATKTVTNAPGPATVLTLDSAFTTVPLVAAVWMLTSAALSPRLYRVLSVAEVDRHKYEVTGLIHNPSKFAHVDRDQPLQRFTYTTIPLVPPTPENVTVQESLILRAGVPIVVVTVEWERVTGATRYRVSYRRDEGNYVVVSDIGQASVDLVDVMPGLYTVQVQAVNVLGAVSPATTVTRQIFGKTAPPSDVQGFVVARTDDSLVFSWKDVEDVDLDYYEVRFGATWDMAVPVTRTVDNRTTVRTTLGGTYLVKAVDTSGTVSIAAAAVVIASYQDINVVFAHQEEPAWAGVRVNTTADATGVLLASPNESGTYETAAIDLGQRMTGRIELAPTIQQMNITPQTWADWTEPWTSYTTPWAGTPGKVSAAYEMALSQDGVTWSVWQTYQAGHYDARAYKIRITLRTTDVVNFFPKLTALALTVDVPDRVLHFEDQAISATGTTLTFSPVFVNVQTIQVTLQGGNVGDTFRLTGKTNAQVTITIYNNAGVAKAGVVDVDVFGYGSV